MKEALSMKKTLCMILALIMIASVCTCALTVSAAETSVEGLTITKISNPDRGEREVDGLVAGGDRENSYTWRLAMRGDEIYIATTRNIASALVNMYGKDFEAAGVSLDSLWSTINLVTNGDIPRNDANEGANIISYNRKTGEFKVIYTAGTGDYFRMAVTFGDNVYFGSYSAVVTNPQYILKLDTDGNFTKVFETMGSVSLRANCVYDAGDGDHLYFAGADDRTPVTEDETAPVAKMAVLCKSNEDDTVWERVADFRDFGTTAYDPIHESWAGAPIWELANHNGYIYATAPTHNGFVIYKGRPAADGEDANEYGWHWTEVAGLTNGINNPGLSDKEGGEPGTMRSLIGSVYEFNGELYAYNFDHSFGGEAMAFAGMMQQLAGKDVKASDYLRYLYDSLQNPQKIWKLNDETGKFEELTAFTELMDGTTNEYVWRLGEYNGDMYVATMDAGIFYNYLTQLTNGSFFKTTPAEAVQRASYLYDIVKAVKATEKTTGVDFENIRTSLKSGVDFVKSLATMKINKQNIKQLYDNYKVFKSELDASFTKASDLFSDADYDKLIDYILTEDVTDKVIDRTLNLSGILFKDVDVSDIIPAELTNEKTEQLIGVLTVIASMGTAYNEFDDVTKSYYREMVKAVLEAYIDSAFDEIKSKIDKVFDSIDIEGIKMYLAISDAVKNNEWGFDLFRTSDGGESFEVITRDGFGDKYNYGCSAFLETEEGLYIGTCNPFYGGQLYLLTNDGSEASETEPDEPDVIGDVDGDGCVTIMDATTIQRRLAGLKISKWLSKLADFDGDGEITILDATFIQRRLADLPTIGNIGNPIS